MPFIDPQTRRAYEQPNIHKEAPPENLEETMENLGENIKLVIEFWNTEVVPIIILLSEILSDEFIPAWEAYMKTPNQETQEIVKDIPEEWLQKETANGQN